MSEIKKNAKHKGDMSRGHESRLEGVPAVAIPEMIQASRGITEIISYNPLYKKMK